VTGAWVGADVRSVAMSRRTVGRAGAASIAACKDLATALTELQSSPYARDVRPSHDLARAQRGVAATLLWNVRVIAGWVPASGVGMLRIAMAWFEIVNVEARLRPADRGPSPPQFEMGSLASTAGGSDSVTTGNVVERLRNTWWGAPSADSVRAVGLAMRSRLIDRASSGVPGARAWAAGAAALIVAREQVAAGNTLPPDVRRNLAHTLGQPAVEADTVDALREGLPQRARWVLDNVTSAEDIWRAEADWWARVEADGRELLHGSSFGPAPVVGAVAVMAADAWRVRAALHAAALGGAPEAFDALA